MFDPPDRPEPDQKEFERWQRQTFNQKMKPINCPLCGLFMRKNWNGLKFQFRCPREFYDDYMGAWEHY
jgi:hypothetical protein